MTSPLTRELDLFVMHLNGKGNCGSSGGRGGGGEGSSRIVRSSSFSLFKKKSDLLTLPIEMH